MYLSLVRRDDADVLWRDVVLADESLHVAVEHLQLLLVEIAEMFKTSSRNRFRFNF